MQKRGVYYRETTYSQRKYLFELVEEFGNVSEACRRAKVSRGTYYNWCKRYEDNGIFGLSETKSHAPYNRHTVDPLIEERIVSLKREHPDWGKKRIAQHIWKENNWEHNVAIDTVKNVLSRHGMWNEGKRKEKKKNKGVTAQEPNKTINIDLCFIPSEEIHQIDFSPFFQLIDDSSKNYSYVGEKSANKAGKSGLDIFSHDNKKYDEKMADYVVMRRTKQDKKNSDKKKNISAIEKKAAAKQDEEELRTWRRNIRIERERENEEWKKYREDRINIKKK